MPLESCTCTSRSAILTMPRLPVWRSTPLHTSLGTVRVSGPISSSVLTMTMMASEFTALLKLTSTAVAGSSPGVAAVAFQLVTPCPVTLVTRAEPKTVKHVLASERCSESMQYFSVWLDESTPSMTVCSASCTTVTCGCSFSAATFSAAPSGLMHSHSASAASTSRHFTSTVFVEGRRMTTSMASSASSSTCCAAGVMLSSRTRARAPPRRLICKRTAVTGCSRCRESEHRLLNAWTET
mmetsp:Transcript_52340/g.152139  ORF Transcript_52340/g.152139 Transcript_52340/m.152139 type:complete len:239 (-) Transcript_52340:62-778(-)